MPIIQEVKDGNFVESVTAGKTETKKSNECNITGVYHSCNHVRFLKRKQYFKRYICA